MIICKDLNIKLLFLALLLIFTFSAASVQSRVEWESARTWTAAERPVDIVLSEDGEWCFLLTEKNNVLIYTVDGKLEGSIKVSPAVKGIDISPEGDKLFLIRKGDSGVEEININFIVKIDQADSPFLGPANAPVVLTVFSDFQ